MSKKFPENLLRRNGKTRTPYFRPNRLLPKILILPKITQIIHQQTENFIIGHEY